MTRKFPVTCLDLIVIFKNPYGGSSSYLFNKDVLALTLYTSNVKAAACPFPSKHSQKH